MWVKEDSMSDEELVEFIRNLNDFNSPEGDDVNFLGSKEAMDWWEDYKREKLQFLEYDHAGKVLVVFERDGNGVGYVQTKWAETMVDIINEGMKRELKSSEPIQLTKESVDVDGTEYISLTTMARLILTTESTKYLMMQHSS